MSIVSISGSLSDINKLTGTGLQDLSEQTIKNRLFVNNHEAFISTITIDYSPHNVSVDILGITLTQQIENDPEVYLELWIGD